MPEVTLTKTGRILTTVAIIHSETRFLVLSIHGYGGEVLHVGPATLVLGHTRSHSETWGGGTVNMLHKGEGESNTGSTRGEGSLTQAPQGERGSLTQAS